MLLIPCFGICKLNFTKKGFCYINLSHDWTSPSPCSELSNFKGFATCIRAFYITTCARNYANPYCVRSNVKVKLWLEWDSTNEMEYTHKQKYIGFQFCVRNRIFGPQILYFFNKFWNIYAHLISPYIMIPISCKLVYKWVKCKISASCFSCSLHVTNS